MPLFKCICALLCCSPDSALDSSDQSSSRYRPIERTVYVRPSVSIPIVSRQSELSEADVRSLPDASQDSKVQEWCAQIVPFNAAAIMTPTSRDCKNRDEEVHREPFLSDYEYVLGQSSPMARIWQKRALRQP